MKTFLAGLSLCITGALLLGLTVRGNWGNPRPNEIATKLNKQGEVFESTLSRGRYAQTMALVEDNVAYLTQGKEQIALPDAGYYAGRVYPLFAPGLAFYMAPAYLLGSYVNANQIAVFGFMALLSLCCALLLFSIQKVLRLPTWAAWFSSFAFLFGTTAFPYAVTIAQHNITVLCLLLLVLAGLKGTTRPWLYGVGWTAYGLAIFMDYPNLLLLFPSAFYMGLSAVTLVKNKQATTLKLKLAAVYCMVFFLLVSGAHAWYNQAHFGSFKNIGTSVYTRVQNEQELQEMRAETLVPSSSPETRRVTSALFHPKHLPRGLHVLFFSLDRGIIFYAPIMLLGIMGIISLSKTEQYKRLSVALTVTMATNVILYGSFGDPWGGWEYGPRYLIISMAILAIGLGINLAKVKSLWYRIVTFVLFMYSAAINTFAVLTTNQSIPSVESGVMEFAFVHKISLLKNGLISSFAYREWLRNYLTEYQYFIAVMILIIIAAYVSVIVAPLFDRERGQ